MTAVGELVLVLGLLVSAHCEVRARDPEVEEEEEELGGRAAAAGGGGGGAAWPPHLRELHPGLTETPPPARAGNWCTFVHKRVVTSPVICGTEKYTIKSQSPCPSRKPDCQLVMYKLSTRPTYRLQQHTVTALLLRCCPGHGGKNCEDTVSDTQPDPQDSALIGRSGTERLESHAPGVQEQLQLHVDPNREQNDHQASHGELHATGYLHDQHNATHTQPEPGHAHNTLKYNHTSLRAMNTKDQQHQPPVVDELDAAALPYPEVTAALPYPEVPAALPVPHMMGLVMSQLQPVLQGFNRSLEVLSWQVGELTRDVAQLKSSQQGAQQQQQQAEPLNSHELDEAAEERLEAKLEDVFQHIREVRRQLDLQRTHVEDRLHSQHAMLHYNLTSFKTDVDMKLKRHQKMLQVSLQAMNATLAELKLDLDQPTEEPLPPPPPPPSSSSDTSTLWEAIERLDNMVVNNTVQVGGLMEDLEENMGNVQQLRRDFKNLGEQINQTARNTQILFMETGLEVDLARESVLRRVGELAGNLSLQGQRLQEMDVDVDYLYDILYKHNTSGDCSCKGLQAAVARLERGVANVTELANENKLALNDNSEGGEGLWGGASDWEPAVEALQRGLQQVKESLASEQSRTRTLDHSLTRLSSSVNVGLAEVSGLKEENRKLVAEFQHLSSSFASLLKDAIRHSDVLELLLGEEVLEFLQWPVQDQEANSIPALKEQLGQLQEQLREHDLSISSLSGNRPGGTDEVPSADQPSSSHLPPDDWLPDSMRRSRGGAPARERQLLLHPQRRHPEHGGDGSDLWNLEKTVEELRLKVLRLEEKPCNTSGKAVPPGGVEAKLQAEVMWLKRGLEEHLRMFKNVFSNADVLAGSDATLELDKLWQLLKNRDGKKDKRRGGGKEGSERGGNHRSRRDSSGVAPVPVGLSEDSVLLVARSPLSISDGVITFEASLNRGQFSSDSGSFTAPVDGIYLFVLTLDLGPGPAHVVLRRGSGAALVSLQRQEVMEAGAVTGVALLPLSEGEEVKLELKGGSWAESEDNVFTVLLLQRTT